MAIIAINAVTRMGMGGAMSKPHGSYAGKVAGPSNVLISQNRGVMRMVQSRIFGRVN